MSPGAVTALVDRLERRGHVERVPNPEDRRSVLVRETGAGTAEVLERLSPYVGEVRAIAEGFSAEERATIARFLERVTGATHRHAEELSGGR